MIRPIATVSLVLCLLTAVGGCDPMVRAEAQAKDYCAKQGLQPLILDRERTESFWMGPTATLKLHCIDPQDIVHTTDAFGAELLSSRNINGAMILKVAPGTIAARAGLAADDVVYEYAAQRIGSTADLISAVAGTVPGQQVLVRARRGKQDIAITADF
jgi:PDZ domain